MNAWQWRHFLESQRLHHRKVLFTVTELAHAAGVGKNALNVELARLQARRLIVKYGHGLYGTPEGVLPEALLAEMDPHAYLTGLYALHMAGIVTQIPARMTAFTDRRPGRSTVKKTPVGIIEFMCIRSRVYHHPREGAMASPAQAFCDFVFLNRRRGIPSSGLVTFRHLESVTSDLASVLARYPKSVQKEVRTLLG